MLEKIRRFYAELVGEGPAREFSSDDYRVAAAALLVHIASIDGDVDAREVDRLEAIIKTQFDLTPDAANRLINVAAQDARAAVDLSDFTNVLNRALDMEGRCAVVALLWDMAYADGTVHEFEENIVWRVAQLLGVTQKDWAALRQRAERRGANGAWAGVPKRK